MTKAWAAMTPLQHVQQLQRLPDKVWKNEQVLKKTNKRVDASWEFLTFVYTRNCPLILAEFYIIWSGNCWRKWSVWSAVVVYLLHRNTTWFVSDPRHFWHETATILLDPEYSEITEWHGNLMNTLVNVYIKQNGVHRFDKRQKPQCSIWLNDFSTLVLPPTIIQ